MLAPYAGRVPAQGATRRHRGGRLATDTGHQCADPSQTPGPRPLALHTPIWRQFSDIPMGWVGLSW
jgi:hypothetical protein